jgi:2-C-methyl-D-erythritol 2,4-cyclodiphosphate synthase
MRDIGYHFPDTSIEYKGIDSKKLLKNTIEIISEKGYTVSNIDSTIALESPKIKSLIPKMQETLCKVMNIDSDDLAIKATTTEKLGFVGQQEGIAAYATVLIQK